ncbi:MAG: phosphotransferase [Candidatus Helarchaeota archaeon]
MDKKALRNIILNDECIHKKMGSEFKIELVEQKVNQIFKIYNGKNEVYAKVSRRGWSKYEWNSLNSLYKKNYYVPKPIHYIPLETPILKDWDFGNLIQENGIIFYYPITGKSLLQNYSKENLVLVLKLLHDFHKENIKPNSPIEKYQESEVNRGLKYLKDLNLIHNAKLVENIKNYSNLKIDYGLIHGDARPEHFLFHNEKIGMIDLEGSCIGDPFKDFGILLGELFFYGYNLNLQDYKFIGSLFGRKLSDVEIYRLNFFLIRRILVKLKYGKTLLSKEKILKTLKNLYQTGYKILNRKSGRILILDSSAFLGGYNPNIIEIQQKTIPEVLNEIKNTSKKSLIEISIETGKLRLFSPLPEFIEKVKSISNSSGDNFVLSDVDIQILALALESKQKDNLTPILVTDDYAMQNIATKLKIGFKPVLEKGIKDLIKWRIYCPGCKKSFNSIPKNKICPDCGTKLKRYSLFKSKK